MTDMTPLQLGYKIGHLLGDKWELYKPLLLKHAGEGVNKPQMLVAGRWVYTGRNLQYVLMNKKMLIEIAGEMVKIAPGYHRAEWQNVLRMYGSRPCIFGGEVFVSWFQQFSEPEYDWSNAESPSFPCGPGARAFEITRRQLDRM